MRYTNNSGLSRHIMKSLNLKNLFQFTITSKMCFSRSSIYNKIQDRNLFIILSNKKSLKNQNICMQNVRILIFQIFTKHIKL